MFKLNEKEQQKAWGPIFLDEDDEENDIERKKLLARLRKKAIEADIGETVDLSDLNNTQLRNNLFA